MIFARDRCKQFTFTRSCYNHASKAVCELFFTAFAITFWLVESILFTFGVLTCACASIMHLPIWHASFFKLKSVQITLAKFVILFPFNLQTHSCSSAHISTTTWVDVRWTCRFGGLPCSKKNLLRSF